MAKHKSANGCGAIAVVIVVAWLGLKYLATATDAPNSKQWATFEEHRVGPSPAPDTAKQPAARENVKPTQVNSETTPGSLADESAAKVASETFVKRQLSHPSTASFPWFGKTAKYNGDGSWTIIGTVNAKNSFNLEATMKYVCRLKRLDEDRWEMVNCNLVESDE